MNANISRQFRSFFSGLALATLVSIVGCVGVDYGGLFLSSGDGPHHGTVVDVLAFWADGIEARSDPMRGGAMTPGFAGRVYLFGADARESMVADGTLTVQLYDDMQPPANPQVPREVWNLDQENLKRVLKKDTLGWGYDLWLPWSNYSKNITKVSVAVVYKPAKGAPVWSGSTLISLLDQYGKQHRPTVPDETFRRKS